MYKIKRATRLLSTLVIGIALLILISGGGIFLYLKYKGKSVTSRPSNYAIYSKDLLNQEKNLTAKRNVADSLYQPIGSWIGRLILPPKEQRQSDGSVFFEVYNADASHRNLVGKVVKLRLSDNPQIKQYVQATTRDLSFTQETENSEKEGNLHPSRLNNLNKVGPLESLAGARLLDDVTVMLKDPIAIEENSGDRPSLTIAQEPVQITGSKYSLVTIVKPEASSDNRKDAFVVRHFNKASKQFDGPTETIRIPQVIADREGIPRSTNRGIEKSPLNPTGWYIYGVRGADGIFVVQAIAPRAIMRLQPDEVRSGIKAGLSYIRRDNWKNTEAQKGTAKTVLLDPATQRQDAVSRWQEGDRAIVIHSFGGIGGKKAEPAPLGVVTGHFAYGMATVIRDPLSGELIFDIEYKQIYAHNPDGIVSGTITWSSYMGDLQRGWLGNRPISDVIVKLDAVTQDYDFDGIKLSPIGEFTQALDIMAARYRVGDGTGASSVNPATSCVQDSNQALYATIKHTEELVRSNPRIQDWLKRHPRDPQTLRFEQLASLGRSLERDLAPLGIVRPDWKRNAQTLIGSHPSGGLLSTLLRTATTWRTMLPRRAQDEITMILLKHGASLWFIRTNQVGGFDPNITPTAPTALLGHRAK